MERVENNEINKLDVSKICSSPADLYFDLENKIKEMLSLNVEKQFRLIYDKLSQKEKLFFDENNFNFKINWVFNINSVYTNRGDISTSSLQKFYHSIFKEFNESTSDKEDFIKFKNTFMELFQVNLLLSMNGENLIIDDYNLNDYIAKIEIKNGFLNIFLKGKGRNLIEEVKNNQIKEKSKIKEVDNDDQFIVRRIINT